MKIELTEKEVIEFIKYKLKKNRKLQKKLQKAETKNLKVVNTALLEEEKLEPIEKVLYDKLKLSDSSTLVFATDILTSIQKGGYDIVAVTKNSLNNK